MKSKRLVFADGGVIDEGCQRDGANSMLAALSLATSYLVRGARFSIHTSGALPALDFPEKTRCLEEERWLPLVAASSAWTKFHTAVEDRLKRVLKTWLPANPGLGVTASESSRWAVSPASRRLRQKRSPRP